MDPKIFWKIENLIAEFEEALFGANFQDKDRYKNHINLESFIDWYLISEITKNVDSSAIFKHLFKCYVMRENQNGSFMGF